MNGLFSECSWVQYNYTVLTVYNIQLIGRIHNANNGPVAAVSCIEYNTFYVASLKQSLTTRTGHSNIVIVTTVVLSNASVPTVKETFLFASAPQIRKPNSTIALTKVSSAVDTLYHWVPKLFAYNSSIICDPAVITNCSPFSIHHHFNSSRIVSLIVNTIGKSHSICVNANNSHETAHQKHTHYTVLY